MHRVVQSALIASLRQPARLIAGRRFPRRTPTVYPQSCRPISIFPLGSDQLNNEETRAPEPQEHEAIAEETDGENATADGGGAKAKNGTSSSSRRNRNRKTKDIPPIEIPGWFLKRNVILQGENVAPPGTTLEIVNDNDAEEAVTSPHVNEAANPDHANSRSKVGAKDSNSRERVANEEGEEVTDSSRTPKEYRIYDSLFTEISTSLAGSLSFAGPENGETFAAGKSHLKLYCPVDGSKFFLQKVVERIAVDVNADVIRIDAQDLAEIAGQYIKEGPEATGNSLWSLSYDAQQTFPKQPPQPQQDQDEGEEESDEYALDESDEGDRRPSRRQSIAGVTAIPLSPMSGGTIDFSNIAQQLQKSFQGSFGRPPRNLPGTGGAPGLVPIQSGVINSGAQQWNDFKLFALLEALMEGNIIKRAHSTADTESKDTKNHLEFSSTEVSVASSSSESDDTLTEGEQASPSAERPKTVLLIEGFKELSATEFGRTIVEKLTHIAQRKRREGQAIMIVGVSASSGLAPEISKMAFEDLQSDGHQSFYRSIVVTPEAAGPNRGIFFVDEQKTIREYNARHLHSMTNKLMIGNNGPPLQDLETFTNELMGKEATDVPSIIESQLMSFDEIHRVAVTALGLLASPTELEEGEATRARAVAQAMYLLERSDDIKTEWANNERSLQNPTTTDPNKTKTELDLRLKKLKKQCTHHEKALLKGVVHPENIRTTFADVHVPKETVESLKNLTMLSLTRPEAFKYGVLASDKITGCLLYGPPGTGKTLLAKAVAKESGATVLEVSGSDVYDMYVGESEKNVRAIFSLARKLTPCVVFIDEADAIFASRGSGNRNSHRELINQFLKEWDGMTEANAFVMIATNRPFDLDDAALRRLPRRLLVDLPVEKDREAILKIHLKDEQVDSSVSLSDLATRTSLYSGSDLKNMCVSAALAAVKEENDAASKFNAEKEPEDPEFIFPERRVLELRHFEKAMDEITASVSEDMSSLGAIRKFDEKYGDRRGRKKRGGYGFSSGEAAKEETAKVRS